MSDSFSIFGSKSSYTIYYIDVTLLLKKMDLFFIVGCSMKFSIVTMLVIRRH